MKIYLLIIISFIVTGCHRYDKRFKIKNNSSRAIYYATDINNNIDTVLRETYEEFEANDGILKVLPGNTNTQYINFPWEFFFTSDKDTMYVHILDANVIENIDYEKVRKDYMVLKRYKVTLKDIQTKPITITYNGEIQNFKKRK